MFDLYVLLFVNCIGHFRTCLGNIGNGYTQAKVLKEEHIKNPLKKDGPHLVIHLTRLYLWKMDCHGNYVNQA